MLSLIIVLFGFACNIIATLQIPVLPNYYSNIISSGNLNTTATAGGAMYTITNSGRYFVSSSLELDPANSRVAAIKVSANNVLINLNATTIYQKTSNTATGLIGIEVDSNVSNVYVTNGLISSLNVADGTEQNAGVVINSGANHIIFENVLVLGCTSDTAEVSGYLLNGCSNVKLIDCESNGHTNTKSTATNSTGTVNGFKLSSCDGCLLENCRANRNTSADQNSYGFRLESSRYNKLLNCTAFNQISNSNDTGDLAAGFYSNSGQSNLFEKCESIGNTGGTHAGSIGAGFILGDDTSNNEKFTSLLKCRAEGNSGGTGDGYGILVKSGVSFCEVRENILVGNTGSNSGYGIYDQNTQANTNSVYIKNFAFSNGKSDGTVVNNYNVSPAPTGIFPVKQGNYNNYTSIAYSESGYDNIEIIQ